MTDVKKPFMPMLYVRSTIYWVFSILALLPVVAAELLFTFPFSVHVRYRVASSWAKINMHLLKWICNLDYKVEGLENVPQGGAIIMAKHQSTWETLAPRRAKHWVSSQPMGPPPRTTMRCGSSRTDQMVSEV